MIKLKEGARVGKGVAPTERRRRGTLEIFRSTASTFLGEPEEGSLSGGIVKVGGGVTALDGGAQRIYQQGSTVMDNHDVLNLPRGLVYVKVNETHPVDLWLKIVDEVGNIYTVGRLDYKTPTLLPNGAGNLFLEAGEPDISVTYYLVLPASDKEWA